MSTDMKKNLGSKIEATPFMSIRDQVAVTGLSERYVRSLLKEGKLPHIMVGNRCMVNVPQLIDLINKETLKAVL